MDLQDYKSIGSVDLEYWYFKGIRDLLQKILPLHITDTFSQRINPVLPLRILNIGCGTGEDIEIMSAFGQVFSIDVNENICPIVSSEHRERLFIANAEHLPFGSAVFDVVIALDVLEHIAHDGAAMREIFRVLKPNGLLFVLVPMHSWLYGPMDRYALHFRRYSKGHFIDLIGEAFQIVRINWWLCSIAIPGAMFKLIRRSISPTGKSSELIRLPRFINKILTLLLTVDNIAIRCNFPLPFGLSMFSVLKKKPGEVKYEPKNQPNDISVCAVV